MKALLYGIDGTVKEFEVHGSPPYFILETDRLLVPGESVEVDQQKVSSYNYDYAEKLFRLINDAMGSSSIGYYAEDKMSPEVLRMRARLARESYNYDYAREMCYMAERVAKPEFSAPVVGKIERYKAWGAMKPNIVKSDISEETYAKAFERVFGKQAGPEAPPMEQDIIGEPKKRLLLIVKEEAE